LSQNALILILPFFTDLRKNATLSLNKTYHAILTGVGSPFRGSARYFLDIALLPKEEKDG
jgi:hypothetical protein